MKHLPLTEHDRKIIRNDMMPGHLLGIVARGVILIGGFVTLLLYEGLRLWTFPTVLLSAAAVGWYVHYRINRKLLEDLKANSKKVVTVTVQRKEAVSIFGHARGKGPGIPLGNLVKTIGKGERVDEYTYFFVIDNIRYRVTREMFDMINDGDPIEMHYTAYGNHLIGLYPHSK